MLVRVVPLSELGVAEWNANRVSAGVLGKLRRSIVEFGVVENLVARPHPDRVGVLEVISGNHRLELYRELGMESAPVVVVEVDDARARLLAQVLNRTRGSDDPVAKRELLERVLASLSVVEVLGLLPEPERDLDSILASLELGGVDPDELPDPGAGAPESRLGEVYELGAHRLACGDATDERVWQALLAGERGQLLVTDPPYGVGYGEKTRLYQPARV